jgi:hypothetical protein
MSYGLCLAFRRASFGGISLFVENYNDIVYMRNLLGLK